MHLQFMYSHNTQNIIFMIMEMSSFQHSSSSLSFPRTILLLHFLHSPIPTFKNGKKTLMLLRCAGGKWSVQ